MAKPRPHPDVAEVLISQARIRRRITVSLLIASKALGKKTGQLFRA